MRGPRLDARGRAADFAAIGGHTSCVALAHDDAEAPSLVLDAGTGLRRLSELLGGQPFRGTILLGHLHWDHTQGLPFFPAGDRPDAEVRLLLPEQGRPPLEILSTWMGPPHFPITPDQLRGSWTFDELGEGHHRFEGFDVLAREIPHPGGRAFGYRISDGHASLAYLSDHGPDRPRARARRLGPLPRGGAARWPTASTCCCTTPSTRPPSCRRGRRSATRRPTTRCAWPSGAGAKRVGLFHHDPLRTDDEVLALRDSLGTPEGLDILAAVEGDVIRL